MRKCIIWLYLMTKRQLKHISTIVILTCMFFTIFAISFIPNTINSSIHVGYYISKDNPLYHTLSEEFNTHTGSIVFSSYDNINDMEKDILAGTLQSGYAFDKNMSKIRSIHPKDSATSMLSNIVILAMIMEHTADDMLIDDILNQRFFPDVTDSDLEYMRSVYYKYATNDSTFSFDYKTLYDEYNGGSHTVNISSYIATPARGLIAILIFISALAAGLNSYSDANIPLRRQPLLRLLNISIPVFLATIIGLAGIVIVGLCNNIFYEIFALSAYAIGCILICLLLSYVVNKYIFTTLIPVFILGSIVCCPIIFNLGNIIPAIKIIQHLFPPTYYITIFF